MSRERAHRLRREVLRAFQATGLRPLAGVPCQPSSDGQGHEGCAIGALALAANGVFSGHGSQPLHLTTDDALRFLHDVLGYDLEFLHGVFYGFDTVFEASEEGVPLRSIRAESLQRVRRPRGAGESEAFRDGRFLGEDVAYALLRQQEEG
jgi:hypothetical protein